MENGDTTTGRCKSRSPVRAYAGPAHAGSVLALKRFGLKVADLRGAWASRQVKVNMGGWVFASLLTVCLVKFPG